MLNSIRAAHARGEDITPYLSLIDLESYPKQLDVLRGLLLWGDTVDDPQVIKAGIAKLNQVMPLSQSFEGATWVLQVTEAQRPAPFVVFQNNHNDDNFDDIDALARSAERPLRLMTYPKCGDDITAVFSDIRFGGCLCGKCRWYGAIARQADPAIAAAPMGQLGFYLLYQREFIRALSIVTEGDIAASPGFHRQLKRIRYSFAYYATILDKRWGIMRDIADEAGAMIDALTLSTPALETLSMKAILMADPVKHTNPETFGIFGDRMSLKKFFDLLFAAPNPPTPVQLEEIFMDYSLSTERKDFLHTTLAACYPDDKIPLEIFHKF